MIKKEIKSMSGARVEIDPIIKHHVKIWFTKKPDEPLGGSANTDRIIDHATSFPGHTIDIITDISRLSESGINKLNELQKTYPNVKFIDLKEIETEIKNDPKGQQLFNLIKMELTHESGNLGAASDICRLLSSVISRGTYSDLDNMFIKMPEGNFNIKDCAMNTLERNGFDRPINNILLFNDPNHPILTEYRDEIIKNYQKQSEDSKDVWEQRVKEGVRDWVINATGPSVLGICTDHYIETVNKLLEGHSPLTDYEKQVQDYLEKNNIVYAHPISTWDLSIRMNELNESFTYNFDNTWLGRDTPEFNYQRFLKSRELLLTKITAIKKDLSLDVETNQFLSLTEERLIVNIQQEMIRSNLFERGISYEFTALNKIFSAEPIPFDLIMAVKKFVSNVKVNNLNTEYIAREFPRELITKYPEEIFLQIEDLNYNSPQSEMILRNLIEFKQNPVYPSEEKKHLESNVEVEDTHSIQPSSISSLPSNSANNTKKPSANQQTSQLNIAPSNDSPKEANINSNPATGFKNFFGNLGNFFQHASAPNTNVSENKINHIHPALYTD